MILLVDFENIFNVIRVSQMLKIEYCRSWVWATSMNSLLVIRKHLIFTYRTYISISATLQNFQKMLIYWFLLFFPLIKIRSGRSSAHVRCILILYNSYFESINAASRVFVLHTKITIFRLKLLLKNSKCEKGT